MESNTMNFSAIDYYMDVHDFLPCDRKKIYDFVNTENGMRKGNHKFVSGYLTRKKLCLVTGYGVKNFQKGDTIIFLKKFISQIK